MMKQNILACSIALLALGSCGDSPLDREQYKKEVYLVGAVDKVGYAEINYADSLQDAFITITTSGTLNIDENVAVQLAIDSTIVNDYNDRFFGPDKSEKYFKVLADDQYEIGSLNVTINHKEGIYKRLPIHINTDQLHCDSTYAIPFRLVSTSVYEIKEELSTLIYAMKLNNEYSGSYQMEGMKNGSPISKSKKLKAVSKNQVRMYIGSNKEDDDTLIGLNTVVLTIADDGSVLVSDWDETQGIEQVSGTGTYTKKTKTFELAYTYQNEGSVYDMKETIVLR